ncbi:hypothetical protein BJ138DRAFT_1131468, partial [Hygrophoropsis aurantiaca]
MSTTTTTIVHLRRSTRLHRGDSNPLTVTSLASGSVISPSLPSGTSRSSNRGSLGMRHRDTGLPAREHKHLGSLSNSGKGKRPMAMRKRSSLPNHIHNADRLNEDGDGDETESESELTPRALRALKRRGALDLDSEALASLSLSPRKRRKENVGLAADVGCRSKMEGRNNNSGSERKTMSGPKTTPKPSTDTDRKRPLVTKCASPINGNVDTNANSYHPDVNVDLSSSAASSSHVTPIPQSPPLITPLEASVEFIPAISLPPSEFVDLTSSTPHAQTQSQTRAHIQHSEGSASIDPLFIPTSVPSKSLSQPQFESQPQLFPQSQPQSRSVSQLEPENQPQPQSEPQHHSPIFPPQPPLIQLQPHPSTSPLQSSLLSSPPSSPPSSSASYQSDPAQQTLQLQPLQYQPPPPPRESQREREVNIWKLACQERVDCLLRRYGPDTIKALVAAQARIRHGSNPLGSSHGGRGTGVSGIGGNMRLNDEADGETSVSGANEAGGSTQGTMNQHIPHFSFKLYTPVNYGYEYSYTYSGGGFDGDGDGDDDGDGEEEYEGEEGDDCEGEDGEDEEYGDEAEGEEGDKENGDDDIEGKGREGDVDAFASMAVDRPLHGDPN